MPDLTMKSLLELKPSDLTAEFFSENAEFFYQSNKADIRFLALKWFASLGEGSDLQAYINMVRLIHTNSPVKDQSWPIFRIFNGTLQFRRTLNGIMTISSSPEWKEDHINCLMRCVDDDPILFNLLIHHEAIHPLLSKQFPGRCLLQEFHEKSTTRYSDEIVDKPKLSYAEQTIRFLQFKRLIITESEEELNKDDTDCFSEGELYERFRAINPDKEFDEHNAKAFSDDELYEGSVETTSRAKDSIGTLDRHTIKRAFTFFSQTRAPLACSSTQSSKESEASSSCQTSYSTS